LFITIIMLGVVTSIHFLNQLICETN
jgi:hypothetical protein